MNILRRLDGDVHGQLNLMAILVEISPVTVGALIGEWGEPGLPDSPTIIYSLNPLTIFCSFSASSESSAALA